MVYDFVIIGGGPAGQAAALASARAVRSVLLLDGGVPRNEAAEAMHNFLSRDGTPPAELRRIAREQLARYPQAEARRSLVTAISGERGRFVVQTDTGEVVARRVILATGMIDELPDVPGYRELWGKAIFQCPYCHGWESRGGAWGVLATTPALVDWATFLTGWTNDLVVFTEGRFEVNAEQRARLAAAAVLLDERPIASLAQAATGGGLEAVVFADGTRLARTSLFAKPKQRHVPLVTALGLTLDEAGFVVVDEQKRTSLPGLYAAGDLTTPMQGAILGAAAGAIAAAMANHDLAMER